MNPDDPPNGHRCQLAGRTPHTATCQRQPHDDGNDWAVLLVVDVRRLRTRLAPDPVGPNPVGLDPVGPDWTGSETDGPNSAGPANPPGGGAFGGSGAEATDTTIWAGLTTSPLTPRPPAPAGWPAPDQRRIHQTFGRSPAEPAGYTPSHLTQETP